MSCSGDDIWCDALRCIYRTVTSDNACNTEALLEQICYQSSSMIQSLIVYYNSVSNKVLEVWRSRKLPNHPMSDIDISDSISISDIHLLLLLYRTYTSENEVSSSYHDINLPMLFTGDVFNEEAKVLDDNKLSFSLLFYKLLVAILVSSQECHTIRAVVTTDDEINPARQCDEIMIKLSVILHQCLFNNVKKTSWLPTTRCKDILSLAMRGVSAVVSLQDIVKELLVREDQTIGMVSMVTERIIVVTISVMYREIESCQCDVIRLLCKLIITFSSRLASYQKDHHSRHRINRGQSQSFNKFSQANIQETFNKSYSLMIQILDSLSGIQFPSMSSSSEGNSHLHTTSTSSNFSHIIHEHLPSLLSSVYQTGNRYTDLSSRQYRIYQLDQWILHHVPILSAKYSDILSTVTIYCRKTLFSRVSESTILSNDHQNYQRRFLIEILIILLETLALNESAQYQVAQLLILVLDFTLPYRRWLYKLLIESLMKSVHHSINCPSPSSANKTLDNIRNHSHLLSPSVINLLHENVSLVLNKILSSPINSLKEIGSDQSVKYLADAVIYSIDTTNPLKSSQENLSTSKTSKIAEDSLTVYYMKEDIRMLVILHTLLSCLQSPQTIVDTTKAICSQYKQSSEMTSSIDILSIINNNAESNQIMNSESAVLWRFYRCIMADISNIQSSNNDSFVLNLLRILCLYDFLSCLLELLDIFAVSLGNYSSSLNDSEGKLLLTSQSESMCMLFTT